MILPGREGGQLAVDRYLQGMKEKKLDPISIEQEKNELENIAVANHISLKLLRSVFDRYLEFLPFTKFASKTEQSSTSSSQQMQTARSNAAKLAILFASTQTAFEYLRRFEKYNPQSNQVIHDACLFTLPESDNLDIKLWQDVIARHNPATTQDMIMRRILPFADKIENYVRENKESLEQALRTAIDREVRQTFESNISVEYDENPETKLKDKNIWINEQLKLKKQLIKADMRAAIDLYFKKQLNLSSRAKPTEEQRALVKERKDNPNLEDQMHIREMEITITQRYKDEAEKFFEKDHANILQNANKTKHEYMHERLLKSEKTIQAIVNDRVSSQLLSASTPISTLVNYASRSAYKQAHKNPEAAALFFAYGMTEERFNEYLSLVPQDDPKLIPPVRIEGEEISEKYKGYYLMKLDPSDPRAAILGKLTSCCQSLGAEGAGPATHGIVSPNGGFYVLCKKNIAQANYPDSIVAQCWAWRGGKQELVFDSVESQMDFRSHHTDMMNDFYNYLGNKLVTDHGVSSVLVGAGGATPASLGFFESSKCIFPIDYSGYRDSMRMRLIADKELPLLDLYILNELTRRSEKPTFKFAYDKTPHISEWGARMICDNLALSFNNLNNNENVTAFVRDFIAKNPMIISLAGLKEQTIVNRIELIKEWVRFVFSCEPGKMDKLMLQNFIDKGINVNTPIQLPSGTNITLLGSAISGNDFEALDFLVKNKADLNCCLIKEDSPSYLSGLKLAILENKISMVQSLITVYKLDPREQDYGGYSSLHFAVSCHPDAGRTEIIDLLLENGLDINSKTKDGDTPLLLAAKYQSPPSFRYNPHIEMEGREEILKFLIEAGADVMEKDNEGKTIHDFDLPPSIIELLKKPRAAKTTKDYSKQKFFQAEPSQERSSDSDKLDSHLRHKMND